MKKIAYTFLHSQQAFAIILSENSQKKSDHLLWQGQGLGGDVEIICSGSR